MRDSVRGGDDSVGTDVRSSAPARVLPMRKEAQAAGTRGKEFADLHGATGREINFRPRRYSAEELTGVRPVAVLRDETGGEHRCEVRDVSQSGIAFWGAEEVFYRLSQEIADVQIRFDLYEAYRGRACVTSIREIDGRTLFGAALLDGLLNMDVVCRFRDIKTVQEETVRTILEATSAWLTPSYRDFKGVMAEYRLFLEEVRARLTELEPRIPWHVLYGEDEDPARRVLTDLFEGQLCKQYVDFLTELDRHMRGVEPSEHPALKAFARSTLHQHVLEAPLFRRSFEKPLGYAGDYVIMTYIYGRKWEGTSLFGKYAHLSAWHIPVCAAVRSRSAFMATQLKELVLARRDRETPVKLLSVAAGPAQELSLLLSRDRDLPPIDFVLFDQDQHALDLCYRRVSQSPLVREDPRSRVAYLHDSIKHLLFDEAVFAGRGPFDLIVCCGLYDYLPLQVAQKLTQKLYRHLAPGGVAFIGNMAPHNPSRFTMEYLAEWYLIYRTPEELAQLGELLPPDARQVIVQEPTGINLFLRLERTPNGA